MKANYRHTNIIARDWQALAKFYQDVFGCKMVSNGDGKVRKKGNLIHAKAMPGGFMKIRKSAFEKIIKNDPDNVLVCPQTGNVTYNFFGRMLPYGEDYSFCKRAEDAGVEMFVQPDCTLYHYGVSEHSGNFKEKLTKENILN